MVDPNLAFIALIKTVERKAYPRLLGWTPSSEKIPVGGLMLGVMVTPFMTAALLVKSVAIAVLTSANAIREEFEAAMPATVELNASLAARIALISLGISTY